MFGGRLVVYNPDRREGVVNLSWAGRRAGGLLPAGGEDSYGDEYGRLADAGEKRRGEKGRETLLLPSKKPGKPARRFL